MKPDLIQTKRSLDKHFYGMCGHDFDEDISALHSAIQSILDYMIEKELEESEEMK